jgi:hypothetical protein
MCEQKSLLITDLPLLVLRLRTVKVYLLVVLSLLIRPILMMASDNAKQDSKNLIEQAEAKANIFALPTFEMKAKVRIISNDKPLDGSYLFLWNGPHSGERRSVFRATAKFRWVARGWFPSNEARISFRGECTSGTHHSVTPRSVTGRECHYEAPLSTERSDPS